MKDLQHAPLWMAVTLATAFTACGGGGGSMTTAVIAPSGIGSVTLDPVTKILTGSFNTTNVVSATAAHIHDGDVGVAGPVVVPLEQSSVGSAMWVVPANTILTDAQIARLQAGGFYVNVHTTLNPTGEIRGQLTKDSATVNKFNATLDQAHEVPATKNPATGAVGGY